MIPHNTHSRHIALARQSQRCTVIRAGHKPGEVSRKPHMCAACTQHTHRNRCHIYEMPLAAEHVVTALGNMQLSWHPGPASPPYNPSRDCESSSDFSSRSLHMQHSVCVLSKIHTSRCIKARPQARGQQQQMVVVRPLHMQPSDDGTTWTGNSLALKRWHR
jgi:hypothetical protein